MFNFLRKYDLYIKPHQDFQIKTAYGGLVSLCAILITLTLFTMELNIFLTPELTSDMRVDMSRKSELPIKLDITFPKAPCDALSFSYIDVAGRSRVNLEHNMFKQHLNKHGEPIHDDAGSRVVIQESEDSPATPTNNENSQNLSENIKKSDKNINDFEALGLRAEDNNDQMAQKLSRQRRETTEEGDEPHAECGSCYGAEDMKNPCCNTCREVEAAYRRKGWRLTEKDKIAQCVKENPELLKSWGHKVKESLKNEEGCRIYGEITVNRVAGSLYIAPGGTTVQDHGSMVHKYPGMEGQAIYDFIYGLDHTHKIDEFHFGEHKLPNQENPLDGIDTSVDHKEYKAIRHTYFLKVVPSTYDYLNGNNLSAAQYSMTQHGNPVDSMSRLPGVWFDFQISPMLVRYKENKRSLTHFLTSLVAIIGGIFAVAGLIDSGLYRSMRSWKKQQLGKD